MGKIKIVKKKKTKSVETGRCGSSWAIYSDAAAASCCSRRPGRRLMSVRFNGRRLMDRFQRRAIRGRRSRNISENIAGTSRRPVPRGSSLFFFLFFSCVLPNVSSFFSTFRAPQLEVLPSFSLSFFFFRKQLSFPTEFVDVLNFVTFLRILVLISSKIWLSLVSTLYYS